MERSNHNTAKRQIIKKSKRQLFSQKELQVRQLAKLHHEKKDKQKVRINKQRKQEGKEQRSEKEMKEKQIKGKNKKNKKMDQTEHDIST